MPGYDDGTADFYSREARSYTARERRVDPSHLKKFMAALPPGGRVLELGCGGGDDSAAMIAAGFDVLPTDGIPAVARAAECRLKRPVAVMGFEDLDARAAFDGVWASACLLHVPRARLAFVIGLVHRALKPAGVFYASFKAGEREGCDGFGRYYNYPTPEWLRRTFAPERWTSLNLTEESGSGYDALPTRWLHVTAVRP